MTCAHDCRYFITIDYSKRFKSQKDDLTCDISIFPRSLKLLARPG